MRFKVVVHNAKAPLPSGFKMPDNGFCRAYVTEEALIFPVARLLDYPRDDVRLLAHAKTGASLLVNQPSQPTNAVGSLLLAGRQTWISLQSILHACDMLSQDHVDHVIGKRALYVGHAGMTPLLPGLPIQTDAGDLLEFTVEVDADLETPPVHLTMDYYSLNESRRIKHPMAIASAS